MKFLLKIITICLSVFVIYGVGKYFLINNLYVKKYNNEVEEVAKKYNIDENLIYAIIKVESKFKEDASSKSGAKGLMQLMNDTAQETSKKIGMSDYDSQMLYDPKTNIELGTKYYKDLYEKYEDNKLALMAYNAGQGNVDKWIEDGLVNENTSNIPYKETDMYWKKVLREYEIYNYLYE